MFFLRKKTALPQAGEALPGRPAAIVGNQKHYFSKRSLQGPYPETIRTALFGIGCFWGAERKFWQIETGIWITAVGYAGGLTPNPTYDEVCSGKTGHNEVVLVAYDPKQLPYEQLLKTFWESHDPTQGMRQGNDVGTQYRSGLYVFDAEQRSAAEQSKQEYQKALATRGYGPITTEIVDAPPFYFAEDYHQQYLAKNPAGYCGLGGTGVACQIGLKVEA